MKLLPTRILVLMAQTTFALTAALLFTGCALTKDYIALNYTPQSGVSQIDGAQNASVLVTVSDQRAVRDRVGSKKNGYGMDMAEIISTNDVAKVLEGALQTELTARGFKLGAGGAQVAVELSKCLNDFKTGWWSGTAVAELVMSANVKKRDGTIAYTRLVNVDGQNTGIQLASGDNAKIAIERALQNGVRVLMDDRQFIEALMATGTPAVAAQK